MATLRNSRKIRMIALPGVCSHVLQNPFWTSSLIGIVQKVFSEKALAIARMRQKCVRNASKRRQKCVKMGLVLLGKEERPKCVRNP